MGFVVVVVFVVDRVLVVVLALVGVAGGGGGNGGDEGFDVLVLTLVIIRRSPPLPFSSMHRSVLCGSSEPGICENEKTKRSLRENVHTHEHILRSPPPVHTKSPPTILAMTSSTALSSPPTKKQKHHQPFFCSATSTPGVLTQLLRLRPKYSTFSGSLPSARR